MKVYKFGGASVKDASSVKNVVNIIQGNIGKLLVVISAMGKTTNALEAVHQKRFHLENYENELRQVEDFHFSIAKELFDAERASEILHPIFIHLKKVLDETPSQNFSKEYDKLIGFGEILSTTILYQYALQADINCAWIKAGEFIKTNDKFQDAQVNWEESKKQIQSLDLSTYDVLITQGFIGSNSSGEPTSLGREGSDFSAAIFAYLTDAESVTIWKDVPGMLNADPRHFNNTVKLDVISYREAIELSYYGASVIHPKTVKPLQNKNIPLYIKSFENPKEVGSVIQTSDVYDHLIPSYIFKDHQTLVSISPKDFSFIEEQELEEIFRALASSGIKMNLMQNSALNFSFVFDHHDEKLDHLLKLISHKYRIRFNLGLKLLNVRYFNDTILSQLTENYRVLISQKTRTNARLVLKDLES